jgi:hypothetical protein
MQKRVRRDYPYASAYTNIRRNAAIFLIGGLLVIASTIIAALHDVPVWVVLCIDGVIFSLGGISALLYDITELLAALYGKSDSDAVSAEQKQDVAS